MYNYSINSRILSLVSDISFLTGRISGNSELSASPILRRENRIKTVQGSLAIEQNTLSVPQVTSVLNGKRVIAPPKDILEVKNAFDAYDRLNEYDPYDCESLLSAHYEMMKGLIDAPGCFRIQSAGVADSSGRIIHLGTLPRYVPDAVEKLLGFIEHTDEHPLISSCVFHFEFESIHPFLDGNGRTGRLWHTLLLSRWNPIFEWLPVESVVHDRQEEYYSAINRSDAANNSTVFIEFMLCAIRDALIEASETIN